MFGFIRNSVQFLLVLVNTVPVHSDAADAAKAEQNLRKVKGLVYEGMNVTLDLQDIFIKRDSKLICSSEVPYVSFLDPDNNPVQELSGKKL